MSQQQLMAFQAAVRADVDLQERLKAAGDADTVVTIARNAGFNVSVDEIKRAQSEISDDELIGVYGGSNSMNTETRAWHNQGKSWWEKIGL